MVQMPEVGFEPTILSEYGPKPYACSSFATRAGLALKFYHFAQLLTILPKSAKIGSYKIGLTLRERIDKK